MSKHLETGNQPKDSPDDALGAVALAIVLLWGVPIASTGSQNLISEHGTD